MNRRKLFFSLMRLAATAPLLAFRPTERPSLSTSQHNEDFFTDWKQLKEQHFSLIPQRVYFNNGTMGPSPRVVQEAVVRRSAHVDTTGDYRLLESVKVDIARFIGAEEKEICLTSNATEAINIVVSGLSFQPGDEIILTNQEHAGHAVPWLNLSRRLGLRLRVFEPSFQPEEVVEQVKRLVNDRTRCIALPHITCTTGHHLPVKEICRYAREKGIPTLVDGAHGPGLVRLNMKEIGCDFYAACGHKWLLGPKGTGFLYVRKEATEWLTPIFTGAEADSGWSLVTEEPFFSGFLEGADRFDYGTQNSALHLGLKEAVLFMERLGMERVEARVQQLTTLLYDQLAALTDKVILKTPSLPEARGGMVTFIPRGKDYRKFTIFLGDNGFRCRLVPEADLFGVRVSVHIYNQEEEIERFVRLVAGS